MKTHSAGGYIILSRSISLSFIGKTYWGHQNRIGGTHRQIMPLSAEFNRMGLDEIGRKTNEKARWARAS
jgi:hypothetical protein